MDNPTDRNMRRAPRVLLLIVAVSVVLRMASAVYQGPGIKPLPGVTDQISYHQLAVRVVEGHGFSFGSAWWPATKPNEPTAFWSYLYVLFLAGTYSIFGTAPLVARILQAVVVGILHPLLVWRITQRAFDPVVALVAAALSSVYAYFVFYAGALVTESLYFVAILWIVDVATVLVYSSRRGSGTAAALFPWILLGSAFAAAALLRQASLLLVPPVIAWIAWHLSRRSRHRIGEPLGLSQLAFRLSLALGVLLVCILPWTVRNQKAFGEFVLLNTNAGFALFWGNHPVHGTEFRPIMSTGSTNYLTLLPRDLRGLNEAQLDKALLARGVGFVKDDPVRYFWLSLDRAKEYFKFLPSPDSSAASNLVRLGSFGLCFPFMLLGILLTLSRMTGQRRQESPGPTLLLLMALMYTLMHLLTWTLVRYRLPVDALLMPFAAVALVFLLQRAFSVVPAPGRAVSTSAS